MEHSVCLAVRFIVQSTKCDTEREESFEVNSHCKYEKPLLSSLVSLEIGSTSRSTCGDD